MLPACTRGERRFLAVEHARRAAVIGARRARRASPRSLPARGCRAGSTRPPVGLSGDRRGRTTSWPGVSAAAAASSPSVRPVTVMRVAVRAARRRPGACATSARAAGRVQVGRDEAAARLEVGEQRRRVADRGRSRRARARTPASRAIASRCSTALVEPPVAATTAIAFSSAVAGHDVARPHAALQQVHRPARRPARRPSSLLGIDRRDAAAAHRREAEELADHRHRVGGELAAAGAGAGAGRDPRVAAARASRHAAGRVRADRFEHVLDRDVVALRTCPARSSRRRARRPGCSSRASAISVPGNRLVAADEHHDARRTGCRARPARSSRR